jgi:alpha-tubulin suppressor-like RCC1 family protein
VPGTFIAITAGFLHTCAMGADSTAFCWGDGRSGAVGDGRRETRSAPARVAGRLRFAELRAGSNFTCGRAADSTVHCWGQAHPVPPFPRPSLTPVRVAAAWPATALTAGRRHACVLLNDATASCWGFNADGENGNGTSGVTASVTPTPTAVAGDLRFLDISAGADFTCALTLDGEPYCWGSNVDGVLGADAPERCGDVAPVPCASRPIRVETSLRFVEIAAGTSHVCARTRQGDVACWGSNAQGQLGSLGPQHPGTLVAPRTVPLGARASAVTVVSGGSHSCALVSGGELYCWGSDRIGQLGAGRNLDAQFTPVRSQHRLAFAAVSAGAYHTCAITRRGEAYCWGDNAAGALGRP